jgi:hypothetical protein
MSLSALVEAHWRARRLTDAIDTIDARCARCARCEFDEDATLRITEDPPGVFTAELDGHCVTMASLGGALLELAAALREGVK